LKSLPLSREKDELKSQNMPIKKVEDKERFCPQRGHPREIQHLIYLTLSTLSEIELNLYSIMMKEEESVDTVAYLSYQ
jgi:hypothetical protein